MRLLHVKILGDKRGFRGLPPGSEFWFDKAELTDGKLEPICLVGLNGSGKSNLLEVICEIFYYLDHYVLAEGKPQRKFKSDFGFEITYLLDVTFQLSRINSLEKIGKLDWEGTREAKLTIVKQPKELPRVSLSSNNNIKVENSKDHELFILPNHVIAYSSGQNELLSNPFIKSSYRYFQQLEKELAKSINLELGLNRLFFLDYESSQMATICNYLFSEQNNSHLVTEELELETERPVDSFSITIHFRNYRGHMIPLPLSISKAIEDLKCCATVYEEIKEEVNNKEEVVELKMAFWFSKELREAFQRRFGSAIALFRDLYYLNLLNIHHHPVETRNRIKEAPSMTYDNLSYMVPVPQRNKLIFVLDKLRFNKTGETEPIKYKNLSDGEHQLMHVLGSIMLLNTSGSLLVYDEPETHFNPEWRSQLITLINKATKEKEAVDKIRKQEIIITSHSPFIVSDCRRERVFIFEKGNVRSPDMNTFGASVNLITMKVFGKTETISEMPDQKLKKIKQSFLDKEIDKNTAIELTDEFGESIEKTLLIDFLIKQE